MIHLQNISVSVCKGTFLERKILDNFTLQISKGEYVIVIGTNGAGKSTLLKAIAGTIPLDAGNIWIDGKKISSLTQLKRAQYIAEVLQDPRIGTIPDLSIEENLNLAYLRGEKRSFSRHSKIERRSVFEHELSRLGMGLEKRLDEPVAFLSGGQRQSLSLLMATIKKCKILLLDEITAALDPKSAHHLMQLTTDIRAQHHISTILVTHNMHHALNYGDRLILIHQGKVIREYTNQERQRLTPSDLSQIFEDLQNTPH